MLGNQEKLAKSGLMNPSSPASFALTTCIPSAIRKIPPALTMPVREFPSTVRLGTECRCLQG